MTVSRILLAVVLLATVAAGVADAAPGLRRRYLPFTQTDAAARAKHVMVVWDDSLGAVNDALEKAARLDRERSFDMVLHRLRQAGVELHFYPYSVIQRDNRALWQRAGGAASSAAADRDSGGYALAIVLNLRATNSFRGAAVRWAFQPDSCPGMQIVHFTPGHQTFLQDNGSAAGQTGALAYQFTALENGYTTPDSAMRVPATGDTLFQSLRLRVRIIPQTFYWPADVDKVVRLLVWGPPGYASGDSLMAPEGQQYACDGWRVYWDSGRWVDYVVGSGLDYRGNNPHAALAWAVVARYLDVPPIPVAMLWNDYAQFAEDPPPGTTTANRWPWPSPNQIDSTLIRMRRDYGVSKVEIGTQADSLEWLWSNHPGYAQIRSVANRGGPEIRWGTHYHTRDSAQVTGSIHTRSTYWGTAANTINFRQVAARRDAGNATAYLRHGAIQKLVAQDSILRLIGAAPGRAVLPGNDILLSEAVASGDATYSSHRMPAGHLRVDSLMYALAAARRDVVSNLAMGQDEVAMKNTSIVHTGTGTRWQTWPEQVYGTPAGDVRFTGYATISSDKSSGPLAYSAINPSINTHIVLGLEQFTTRQSTVRSPLLNSNNTARRANVAIGRSRIWGWHVNFISTKALSGWGIPGYYDLHMQEVGVLKNVKALEQLAGKKLVEWVWPEEAFGRY